MSGNAVAVLTLMELESFNSDNRQTDILKGCLKRKESELKHLRMREVDTKLKMFFNNEQQQDNEHIQIASQKVFYETTKDFKERQQQRQQIQQSVDNLHRKQQQQQEEFYLEYENSMLAMDLLFTEGLLLSIESNNRTQIRDRQQRSFTVIQKLHNLQYIHPIASIIPVGYHNREERRRQSNIVNNYIQNTHLYSVPVIV